MRNCVDCGQLLDSNEQICSRCYADGANPPVDSGEVWIDVEPPPHKDDF